MTDGNVKMGIQPLLLYWRLSFWVKFNEKKLLGLIKNLSAGNYNFQEVIRTTTKGPERELDYQLSCHLTIAEIGHKVQTGPLGSYYFLKLVFCNHHPQFTQQVTGLRCSIPVRTVNLHNLYSSPLKQIYTKYELFLTRILEI